MEEILFFLAFVCMGVGVLFLIGASGDSEHAELMAQGPPCEYGTHPERIGYSFDRGNHEWNPVYACVPDTEVA